MKKKLLMFLLLLFCLIPLTGCPPKLSFHNILVYELNEEKELIDNKVQFYVGHRHFLESNYYKQFDCFYYTDFCVGMKIDENKEYHTKYIVPDEDVLSMKYYYSGGSNIDNPGNGFKKDSKFEFNLSNIDIKNKVYFIFSYIYVSTKFIYEYEMEVSLIDNIIYVNKVQNSSEAIQDYRGEN